MVVINFILVFLNILGKISLCEFNIYDFRKDAKDYCNF